ncbi:TetR/AcrR family transcriptional regulator [Apilactobacillus nanyangensis]|uniref:TetR/AcrR family transcriptional regulator n=1 Tax=Apilactobacillus nanyangensis TaxID=2799579 RepID=A0ABT0HZ65_9LACO|nr:TetR/AcrR family transcriptional regulator [Apilactobacillus nanyangensis]MCK8612217.1 TetR/AcrR family transcriptional regulator [Apilactobacillus nanyangensis]
MRTATISKEDIIKTAIITIEKGDKLTFSTISRRMKITSQSLYNYFKNQQELEYAIVGSVISSACQIAQYKTFGKSGHDGVIYLAQTFRRMGIKHINLAQFVISHHRTNQYKIVTDEFNELKIILDRMLESYFDSEQILKASRLIRSLVVGDILNVGTGWFKSPEMRAESSFVEMLDLSLNALRNS